MKGLFTQREKNTEDQKKKYWRFVMSTKNAVLIYRYCIYFADYA